MVPLEQRMTKFRDLLEEKKISAFRYTYVPTDLSPYYRYLTINDPQRSSRTIRRMSLCGSSASVLKKNIFSETNI